MRGPQATTAPPQAAILGLCPKCDRWFTCDDFFNPAVAMPCCPHCQLAPSTLDYRFPQAAGTAKVADAMVAAAGARSL